MKVILFALTLIFVTNLFAKQSPLDLEGAYVSDNGFAFAKARVIKSGDLFSPDSYKIDLEVINNARELDDVSLVLEQNKEEELLTFDYPVMSLECDDPGCTYYESFIFRLGDVLSIFVEGFVYDDGEEEGYSFSHELEMKKAYQGKAYKYKNPKKLKSKKYAAEVQKGIVRFTEKWNATATNIEMKAVGKIINKRKVEGLYILTTFELKTPNRRSKSKHQCLTIVTKEKFVLKGNRYNYHEKLTDCRTDRYYNLDILPLR